VEYLISFNTYQFTDYTKYHTFMFDIDYKKEVRLVSFLKTVNGFFKWGPAGVCSMF